MSSPETAVSAPDGAGGEGLEPSGAERAKGGESSGRGWEKGEGEVKRRGRGGGGAAGSEPRSTRAGPPTSRPARLRRNPPRTRRPARLRSELFVFFFCLEAKGQIPKLTVGGVLLRVRGPFSEETLFFCS